MQMTIDTIDRFEGQHWFLSNFSHSAVYLGGLYAPTVEHAFQAAKTERYSIRKRILETPHPAEAKKLGRRVPLRDDWEEIKLWIMEDLLYQKFNGADALRWQLLDTGEATLIEGNTWGDKFWGVCGGEGENRLGHLLMKVRKDLR